VTARVSRRGAIGALRRLLTGVAPGAPGYRTNYVPNPSFEVSDVPGSPDGQRYGGGTFSRDTTVKQVGAASLKLTATSTVDSGQWESMALGAGTYTASVWIKTDNVTNACMVLRDPGFNDIGSQTHLSGTKDWTRYSNTFTLSAPTTVQMLVGLGSYGSTSAGTVWFDGMMIEAGSNVGPYFDGGYSAAGSTVAWSGGSNASPSTEKRQPATIATQAALSASSTLGVSLASSGSGASNPPSMSNLYKASQQVDNYVSANPSLSVIADQPQARWINTQGDADNMGGLVSAAGTKTLLICIYAIPGRDNGQYSAGGFPDRASYLNFLQTVKTKIGTKSAFIFFEPDALGLTNGLSASLKAERIETLRQGIDILATIPNAETYIDASKWISPSDQAGLQAAVDIAKVSGIVMNVSGYDSMDSCYSYGEAVLSELANRGITGKKYMIDSGRNGVGPLTDADRPLANPWLDTSQAWCNPPKRRLGPVPQVPSGRPNCRGLVWVKNPGESDGTFPSTSNSTYYGENAPSAGAFWLVQAKMLAGTEPSGGSGTPANTGFSAVVTTFDGNYGGLSDRSAGVSLVGGRARLTADTSYANISTPGSYTLKESSVYARLFPPSASGATQAATVQFLIRSTAAADGTRLNAEVNTFTGKLTIASDSGYYDANAVQLTYDATAHAFLRWREAGGTVYLETSSDGNNWTTRRSLATPSWLTATNNQLMQFVAYKDAGAAAYAEVDNVNTTS